MNGILMEPVSGSDALV